jgi:hypothetical protein
LNFPIDFFEFKFILVIEGVIVIFKKTKNMERNHLKKEVRSMAQVIRFEDAKKEKANKELAKDIIKLGNGLLSLTDFKQKHKKALGLPPRAH